MLIAKNKLIFFDNDDQFIDYCLKRTPSFYTSDKGNSYYDYDYTDDYKYWISLGKGLEKWNVNNKVKISNMFVGCNLIKKQPDWYIKLNK